MNARQVDDLVTMFNAMSGEHRLDPWSRRTRPPLDLPKNESPMSGLKALFIPAIGGNKTDEAYMTIVRALLEKVEDLELDFADNDPTNFDPGIATQMIICNLAARVRQLTSDQQERLGPVLKGLLDSERYRPDGVRVQADAIFRSKCYDTVEQLLTKYNFILSPTLTAPPPLADPTADQSVLINGEKQTIDKWWSHLSLANQTGHPAASIPCGYDENGLPVGLHAIARWDREQDLIELASAVSQITEWRTLNY